MAATNRTIAGIVSDAVVSASIVSAGVWIYSVAVFAEDDKNLFLQAVFFSYLASIFVATRFYSGRVLVLRVIRWVCEHLSFPRGLYMTIVYAVVCSIVALVQFARWLY